MPPQARPAGVDGVQSWVMFRRAAIASGGLLVLFHAWLLGHQLWDGQLLEPGLAIRWFVAGGLVAALAALRRSGGSLVWGRQAVSIWLLAALLHGPAVAEAGLHPDSPALPEAVTALVQIAASAALGLGLLLVAAFLGRRTPSLACRHAGVADRRPRAMRASGAARFAPRPPPLRLAIVSV